MSIRRERCEGKRKYHAEGEDSNIIFSLRHTTSFLVEKKRKQYVTDQIQRLGDLLPFDRPKDLNVRGFSISPNSIYLFLLLVGSDICTSEKQRIHREVAQGARGIKGKI